MDIKQLGGEIFKYAMIALVFILGYAAGLNMEKLHEKERLTAALDKRIKDGRIVSAKYGVYNITPEKKIEIEVMGKMVKKSGKHAKRK